MKISIRSLTFGLAATLASAVMAQMPYTVTLNGIVPGCYAGQTVNLQTLQNTVPAYLYTSTGRTHSLDLSYSPALVLRIATVFLAALWALELYVEM